MFKQYVDTQYCKSYRWVILSVFVKIQRIIFALSSAVEGDPTSFAVLNNDLQI